MIYQETIFSKIFHQMLRDLIVRHYHELLDKFLTIHSFLDTDVNRIVLFVQLETYLVPVKNFSVHPGFSFFKGDLFQYFYLFSHLVQSF